MEDMLNRSPGAMSRLLASFSRVRSAREAVSALGLHRHPLLASLSKRDQTSKWIKRLTLVLYQCDIEAQFQDVTQERKHNRAVQTGRKRKAQDIMNGAAPPLEEETGYERILKLYMTEHVRSVCRDGAVLSLPSSERYLLQSFIERVHQRMGMGAADALAIDVEDSMDSAGDTIFMKVALLHPQRLKTVPMLATASRRLCANHIVVSLHDLVSMAPDESSAQVSPKTRRQPELLDLSVCTDVGRLREKCLWWQAASGPAHCLIRGWSHPELSSSLVQQTLQELLMHHAVPSSRVSWRYPVSGGLGCVLQALHTAGLVARVVPAGVQDGVFDWALTADALSRLEFPVAVATPEPLFSLTADLTLEVPGAGTTELSFDLPTAPIAHR